ncbi:hypothetical protein [Clostridioides difficile]|uniref:hypothetical protein n=1 Tax=Clostridioides difficile TaxID=1496 RepID=UPI000A90C66D|nr:hypothetical protein [Clostridioides difficile]EGT4878865.1 hypothetical protein [Clostridioides difficile]QHG01379.1 hypothetical protein DF008_12180 [Clostridioides difficile]HBF5712997.1 hypothetical protein [Clostridioides difficile]HBH1627620.1 hypothetical protein [Clostridioides difficile]HBH3601380.1 hypothetical protein [Clostridioides difficile]
MDYFMENFDIESENEKLRIAIEEQQDYENYLKINERKAEVLDLIIQQLKTNGELNVIKNIKDILNNTNGLIY